MSQMSPALDAALTQRQATIFGAIQLQLPGRTVRLLIGSGFISFPVAGVAQTFTGKDNILGVFSAIENLTDGSGDEAPAISLTFIPASDAATVALAAPSMQGASVLIWLGAVDPTSGLVVGDPLLIFNGLLDVASIKVGQNTRTVEYEVTSVFEDFFLSDDGARLSSTFHEYIWPGELGLEFVTYVTNQIYWGSEAPSGVTKSAGATSGRSTPTLPARRA